MRFLYSLLYTCAFLILLPYFLIVGLIRGKYLSSAWERFGNIPQKSDRPSIWIHAVSVGEFLACRTLIQKLKSVLPEIPLFVSTTTMTSQRLATQVLPGSTFFFPFDWQWTIRKVLRRIQPQIIVVLETEIWPNFLWSAQSLSIPTMLINGRLSERSMQRYSRFKKWLPHFTESWMQTEKDAEKMRSLGAGNVFISGNLKYDVQPAIASDELATILTGWKEDSLVWIAGSTMPGEEQLILETFKTLRQDHDLKLLIAPRHPERFAEVRTLIAREGFQLALRSEWSIGAPSSPSGRDVLLLDSIGELAGAYEFADIVLIGGTLLEDGGGHNPIEPASFGKPIVSGIHFSNFLHIFQDFQRSNAIFITDHLLTDMRQLLNSPEKRSAIGAAARSLVEQNAGATQKILDGLLRLMEHHRMPAQLLN